MSDDREPAPCVTCEYYREKITYVGPFIYRSKRCINTSKCLEEDLYPEYTRRQRP